MKRIPGRIHQNAFPSVFRNARFLRERMTVQEKLVWERIRKNQICNQGFRRQHPIGSYILDFFCVQCKLSIEIDGSSHNSILQQELDLERTKYLNDLGIDELRFTNEEIIKNLDNVIEKIRLKVETKI